MSPIGHFKVGVFGGAAIHIIFNDLSLAVSFLLGSFLITDVDHFIAYCLEVEFKEIFNIKKIVAFHHTRGEEFSRVAFLHLYPLHSIEFLTLLMIGYNYSYFFSGLFWGCFIHIVCDDLALFLKTGLNFQKRCHSIIEYLIRRFIFRQKIYREIWK